MKFFTKPPLGTPLNPAHPLNRGLVLYMPFSEGAGSKTQDLSGRGNHGTLIASPKWVGGKFGGSLSFNGVNTYVSITNSVSFNFGTDGFAVSFWGNANIAPSRAYFAVGKLQNSGPWDNFNFGITANGFASFTWRTGGTSYSATGATDLTDGIWHHFLGVRNSSGIHLYVDGFFIASNTNANTQLNEDHTEGLTIGRERTGTGDESWIGEISEVRIYNRALSAQEVQQLYTDPFCMYESKSLFRWFSGIMKGSFFFRR